MKQLIVIVASVILLLCVYGVQGQVKEGTISGKILSSGNPVPFANVGIKGSTLGTTTNEMGEFKIDKVPLGVHELQVSHIGFERWLKSIILTISQPEVYETISLSAVLKTLDEVVVTGTRSEKRRIDTAVPVNILDTRVLEATQSLNLSEGLSFQPGIRVEKDCQTCNYTQVRMNGLAGSYTQILINSRPIFSSLAGLYGLEQFPVSMIERVEIVKGGGSVLYGSSAIAGTVNIITREPSESTIEFNTTGALINGSAADFQNNVYASLINKSRKAGTSLIFSQKSREPWDANGDGFSELAKLKNLSLGMNSFLKPNKNSKISIGVNSINEIRNGGDRLGKEPHLRLQSEYRDSKMLAGNLDYSYDFYGVRSRLDIYTGLQKTIREHYTGSFGADGYGTTDNNTFIAGFQFSHTILNFINGKNTFTLGSEYQYDYVMDEIEAYNYLIDQETFQSGIFLQSDWELHRKINLVTGIRLSKHNKTDENILSPRINLMYKITSNFQARVSRSSGFRAPQAFDSDMHIAFSGGGIALTEIDSELKPEESVSYMASLDYNYPHRKYIYGFTISGFHTKLENTFILEEKTTTDPNNNSILFRTNGGNSYVKGITAEVRANYNYILEGDLGYTIQESLYENAVAWSNSIPGTSKFLRTPSGYGYFTLSYSGIKRTKVSFSGVYTGTMLVPHFAGAPGVETDELVETHSFMELNFKAEYRIPLAIKPFGLTISGGIQNLFNAYQNDFDTGPIRDSNYIYGPGRPRTYFLGISFSRSEL